VANLTCLYQSFHLDNDCLEFFVNRKKESISAAFNPSDFDLSNKQSLRIGFDETDYFSGKIREVRIYNRAINVGDVKSIVSRKVYNEQSK